MPSEDLTALVIRGDSFDYGIIDFCTFDRLSGNFYCPEEWRTKYLGMAGLFAAIISDRVSDYNCLMEKASTKLAAVAKVYAERDHMLLETYGAEDSYCTEAYYKERDESEAQRIAEEAERGFANIDLGLISSYMSDIESRNRQALIASCAQLY